MSFCVLAHISQFSGRMPLTFESTSPDCRIATERYNQFGSGLRDSSRLNMYRSWVHPPWETMKGDNYLTMSNLRHVELECASIKKLSMICGVVSWWWQRKQSCLPLKMGIRGYQNTILDVDAFIPCESLLPSVVSLYTDHFMFIKNAEQLPMLQSLFLKWCNREVVKLEHLAAGCPYLRHLCIYSCELEASTGLTTPTQLRCLELSNCVGSVDLDVLKEMPYLVELRITRCPNLVNISSLRSLANIQIFEIGGVAGFTFDLLERMQLTEFAWMDEYPFHDLQIIKQQMSLRVLTLPRCEQLTSLDGLEMARLLETLNISCGGMEVVSLPSCPALKELNLCHCASLVEVTGLQNAPLLSNLMISGSVVGSLDLPPRCSLREIRFCFCRTLHTLTGLQNASRLCELVVYGAALESLDLPPCASLKELKLSECGHLRSVSGLENAPCLSCLTIEDASIESFDLPLCMSLTELSVRGCRKLRNISGLQNIPRIKALFIEAAALESLDLPHYLALSSLSLFQCQRLHVLTGLRNLPYLARLNLSLTDISDVNDLEYCTHLIQVQLPSGVKESDAPVLTLLRQRKVALT